MIAPGLRIGRYEIGERLGKGGFGVVHLARDVELERDIAIKVLKPEYLTRPQVVQRFIKEARAAAKIGHPGIVIVFECGQISGTGTRADGNTYIAMELLRGQSLADRLADRGRLPAASVIEIGRQLASALAVAHAAGIVHRDLKPDNIFLVPDAAVHGGERVKILDFGVAKLADPGEGVHTHSQMLLGTPRYMPPEQARSAARVDHRSDIYTLGCILFEMLCGRAPYSGDSGDQIIRHQTAPIPSPRDVVADAPAHLDTLIRGMLAKSPDDRPQSMIDVDDALAGDAAELETTVQRPTLDQLRGAPPPVEDTTTTTTTTVSESSTMNQRARRVRIAIAAAIGAAAIGVAAVIALRDDPSVTLGNEAVPTPAVVNAEAPEIVVDEVGCDADRSKEAAQDAYTRGDYARALEQFEESYACRSNADTAMRAFISACNLERLELAREWFAVLSGSMQDQTKVVCIRNGISEQALRASRLPDEAAVTPANVQQSVISACKDAADKKQWSDVIACSEQLAKFDSVKATGLRELATREATAEARSRGMIEALKTGDFKRAKDELDAIPNGSVYRKSAQDDFDRTVEPLVNKLAGDVARAKDDRCESYQALVRRIEGDHGIAIVRLVTARVSCTPRAASARAAAACDADKLKDSAQGAFSSANYGRALKLFEESYVCRSNADTALRAFIAACNLKRLAPAKKWYGQLSGSMKNQTKIICIRNGIKEEDLGP